MKLWSYYRYTRKRTWGHNQYVDNDVYVDDVDDDEAGADSFFARTQRCSHQL